MDSLNANNEQIFQHAFFNMRLVNRFFFQRKKNRFTKRMLKKSLTENEKRTAYTEGVEVFLKRNIE